MAGFSELLALTRAAESCCGSANEFVRRFRKPPIFSRDPYVAIRQAAERRRQAELLAERMQGYVDAWVTASTAHDFVLEAVGLSRPEIAVDGRTYPTAHEGACRFAEAVMERFEQAIGDSDADWCTDLVSQLEEIGLTRDLWGRLQQEHFAAASLVPDEEGQTLRSAAAPKKIKPTANTLEIIRKIERHRSNAKVFELLGPEVAKSVDNVRKVRSQFEQGKYQI